MTYGFPSKETTIALRENGFDFCWNTNGRSAPTYTVSLIFGGALDEEFDINDMYDPVDIGQCIYKNILQAGNYTDASVHVTHHDGTEIYRGEV